MANTLFLLSLIGTALAANPTATITSKGVVLGTKTVFGTASATVNKFLGIPYASNPPPMFMPPSAPSPWTSTLKVQTYASACYEKIATNTPTPSTPAEQYDAAANLGYDNPPFEIPLSQSTSCLFLNVFAPAGANLLPVMFWIYGGSLQTGASNFFYYNGTSIAANQDVVVVTINYRTNVFGFSNSPYLLDNNPHYNNAGFYDQRLALQWVQENIKSFGGDPNQITIFGESAGASSVAQLLSLPPTLASGAKPYAGAIMESYAVNQHNLPGQDSSTDWNKLAQTLGCTGTDQQIFTCVQGQPPGAIEAAVVSGSLSFKPIIDNITCVNSIKDGVEPLINVPVMIGTNANEAELFLLAAFDAYAGESTVDTLAAAFGDLFPGSENGTPIATAIANDVYKITGDASVAVLSRAATDFLFTCPSRAFAQYLISQDYPVWRYWYDASFPNTDGGIPGSLAYHASEIPSVFGTYYANTASSDQIALSTLMQTAWATFAKNAASNNGVGPGSDWPQWGSVASGKDLEVFTAGQTSLAAGVSNYVTSDTNCADLIYDVYNGRF